MGYDYYNKGAGIKLMPRLVYIVAAIFAVIVVASPVRRVIYDTWTLDMYGFWTILFKFHVWLPLVLIFPAALTVYHTSTNRLMVLYGRLWSGVANRPRLIWGACVVILPAFAVMQFNHVTGMWWTWFTLGLHIGGIAVVYTMARGRLGNSQALIFAVGMIAFAIGLWEIFYQYSFAMVHGAGLLPIRVPNYATMFMSPTIFAGILSMYLIRRHHRGQINFYMGLIPLGLCIATWIAWLSMGMWVDAELNEAGRWTHSTYVDHGQMSIYRSGKVWLNLIPAAMLIKGEWVMKPLKQAYIMAVWCFLTVCSTVVLGVEWAIAIVKRQEFKPYFATRSIFVKEEE